MTAKVQRKWHWTFDRKDWPQGSFFGRRWLQFQNGEEVIPSNGCVYFWACVWVMCYWPFFTFPTLPFRWVWRAVKGEPVFAFRPEGVDDDKPSMVRRAHDWQKERLQSGKRLAPLGRSVHFVSATRFSPLRLLGLAFAAGLSWSIDTVADLFTFHPKSAKAITLATVAGLIGCLVIMAFLAKLLLLYILAGIVIGFALVTLAIYLLATTETGKVIAGFISAVKNRYCPGIELIDSRKSSSA